VTLKKTTNLPLTLKDIARTIKSFLWMKEPAVDLFNRKTH
jgi:hypothetical protein